MSQDLQELQLDLWRKLCFVIDGLAVSGCVQALRQQGLLARLEAAQTPLAIEELTTASGAASGYLHLAFRLMEDQGFVHRSRQKTTDAHLVELSQTGSRWLEYVVQYDQAVALLQAASSPDKAPLSLSPSFLQGLKELSELQQRVRLHLVAPLIGSFLVQLYGWGMVGEGKRVAEDSVAGFAPDTVHCYLSLLQDLGWMVRQSDGSWGYTEEGQLLVHFIPQLFYPVSYLKTACRVPELIFPGAGKGKREDAGEESHIDRALDIRFSGLVYQRNFREPVHRLLADLFNSNDLGAQPLYIVDTGCGDGTMLLDVYRYIAEETRRGRELERYPVTLVGIEYNEVARNRAAEHLAQQQVPFFTLQGDVSRPEAIAASLLERGITPDQAFHMSKSVIHNRIYCPPRKEPDLKGWEPISDGVFVGAAGQRIGTRDLAVNLVDHLRRWRPLVQRHGMLAIEAHCVPARAIASSLGRNCLTSLDSSHGFSHQYLVERDFFYQAIDCAGYSRKTIKEQCLPGVDAPVLSVNYLTYCEKQKG